jgi:hypothetical protein
MVSQQARAKKEKITMKKLIALAIMAGVLSFASVGRTASDVAPGDPGTATTTTHHHKHHKHHKKSTTTAAPAGATGTEKPKAEPAK